MNRINKKVRIPDQATTLAEVLKKNGYLTAGFSGGANISSVFGFDKGFNFYNERWRTEIDVVFKNLSDWIQKHRKDKFFLFFHTYEIHEYPPGEHEIFTEGINPRDKVNMHNALYDGKIKYVDDYIGRLIERLKSLNLLDKTLIVITSDHGEEFFEHGLGGHGDHLYDEVLLVPLIFHLKGTVPENVMIKNQVRVIDIMPTVLDILDVPVPKIIEGVSLVPFFKKSATTPLVAFTEAADNLNRLNIVEPVSIRTPEYKYIFYPRLKEEVLTYLKSKKKITGYSVDMYNQGEGELYNLIDDPEELNNIIKLNNSVAKDLRNEVVSFININQEKDFTKGKPQETVKIDRATRERLEALGYLQ